MDSFYENNSPRDDMENCLSAQFNSASVGYEDGFAPEYVERQLKPSSDSNADDNKTPLYPMSFRVTADEKVHIERAAGKSSVSRYVRQCVLGDLEDVRPHAYGRKQRKPDVTSMEIARLLGMFGQSEIATSMLALSLAAQAGELEVDDAVTSKIESACEDIETIKVALIMALGVKPQGNGRKL